MNQEYILLRKENDLLDSLIGKSFNEKSKFEAEKILDEIHSKAESRIIGKKALCYIVNKNEILGVGGSTLMKDKNGKIISNLILDQFGIWLSTIFKQAPTATLDVNIKDETNTNRLVRTYGVVGVFNLNINLGTSLRVGSGNSAPVRTNFNVETGFGVAPEQGFFSSGTPVWNSGLGNFKNVGSIIAGGAGTINESVIAATWLAGVTPFRFILFRDIISPAQAFIAGQTIALEYTVQM